MARPRGGLVWCHAEDPTKLPAINVLAERLLIEEVVPNVLVTAPGQQPDERDGIIRRPAPQDRRRPIRDFLDHWDPDLMTWSGGPVRPRYMLETDSPAIPRVLLDGSVTTFGVTGGGWLPRLTRATYGRFDHALAVDSLSAIRIGRQGVGRRNVQAIGPLDEGTAPPPCNEAERADLAEMMASRQIWLAVDCDEAELPTLVAAQAQTLRRAHRLLLIVVPSHPSLGPAFAEAFRAGGLQVALRSEGRDPDNAVQVYVADIEGEHGLWYRLAPVVFMGGTLVAGQSRNPYEAAALGSATIHGPLTDPFPAQYGHLARAGGTHMIRTPAELAAAVEALQAPDRAAQLAHAAWDVSSRGAEVTNRAVEVIRDALKGVSDNART